MAFNFSSSFRAVAIKQWRSILANSAASRNRSISSGANRRYATSSSSTTAAGHHHEAQNPTATKHKMPMGDLAPIMIMGGFVAVVIAIATHSVWQQLAYAPGVQVRKKKRETLPEVYDRDTTWESGEKFINKSFLRKVGHIQEPKPSLSGEPSTRPDPFTRSNKK